MYIIFIYIYIIYIYINLILTLFCSPNENGPGQQCCYEKGILVKKPRGGSADRESPLRNFNLHILTDLLPFILCCKGTTSVCSDTYYQARPEGTEMGYRLPVPGKNQISNNLRVLMDILKNSFSSLYVYYYINQGYI